MMSPVARVKTFVASLLAVAAGACSGGAGNTSVPPSGGASLLASGVSAAQRQTRARFRLEVLGTLGGPQSVVQIPYQRDVNDAGTVAGCADTSAMDPNYPNFNALLLPDPPIQPDQYIFHSFSWRDGEETDLGGLHRMSSCPNWISDTGAIVGASLNGKIDPYNGFPALEAVLWQDGRQFNLGTFGGNESYAVVANNRGEVVGYAANTTPDSYSFFYLPYSGTQSRAFLWRDGHKKDLGTLGGPDALAMYVDDRGRIYGASYTSNTPNPITGIPPFDAFVWRHGHMRDIPNKFGGAQTNPVDANNRGQLVGGASDSSETCCHPFLWDNGVFKKLPRLGACCGTAQSINDAGEAVGQLFFPPSNNNIAMLWEHDRAHKLGTLPGDTCSRANAINRGGAIVGYSGSGACPGSNTHAVLWERLHITDLNAEIPQSDLLLVDADSINESGEIAGVGLLPSGEWRAYLLIPCKGYGVLPTADCQKPARGTIGIPFPTQIEVRQSERLGAASTRLFTWQRYARRNR